MTINIKNKHNGQTAPANINLQDVLVKASREAEIAKSAVKEVFNQVLRQQKESINELETLNNIDQALEDNGIKSHEMPSGNSNLRNIMNELDTIKQGFGRKIVNNGKGSRNTSTVTPKEILQNTDRLNEAVSLAREKIRRSREEADTYKKHAHAAVVTLEDKQAKMREKVKALKQQLLISKREAQTKAQKAYDEAEAIRRETRATVKQAKMENRKIVEDAKMEVINAQEEARRAKKAAELAISKVTDTIMKVQQEIIDITINEMSETEQEFVEVTKSTGRLVDNQSRTSVQNINRKLPLVKFDWAIQLLQNTKQTIQHIFRPIKTRFYSKGL